MGDTKIQWTEKVWNPVRGCSPVSAGCDHCYAAANARRFEPALVNTKGQFNGTVRCLSSRLEQPLHWKKPRMVFVSSMGDLFHEDVPIEFIDKVLAVIRECPRHTFQILTKRSERLWRCLSRPHWRCYTRNLWVGVTVEDDRVVGRIADLRRTPAAVRFLSCEPLLGPLDLPLDGIDWVIVGGESGPGARLCKVEWIRSIVEQCRAAGVSVFVKQLGNNSDWPRSYKGEGADPKAWPSPLWFRDYPNVVQSGA